MIYIWNILQNLASVQAFTTFVLYKIYKKNLTAIPANQSVCVTCFNKKITRNAFQVTHPVQKCHRRLWRINYTVWLVGDVRDNVNSVFTECGFISQDKVELYSHRGRRLVIEQGRKIFWCAEWHCNAVCSCLKTRLQGGMYVKNCKTKYDNCAMSLP